MNRNQIIVRLLEIDSSLDRIELSHMPLDELREELGERTDLSNLFPNSQDDDAGNEDHC